MALRMARRRRRDRWSDIPVTISLAEVMKDLVEPAPRFGGYSTAPRTDGCVGRRYGARR